MLYIEDFKRAYRSGLTIVKHECELEELEIKKSIAKKASIIRHIDAKIDTLHYLIGILRGNQMEVEEFIKTTEDSYLMNILYYRYINGASWQGVAYAVSQGVVSHDAVRKTAERYLKSKGITHRPKDNEEE